ncbi:MAG TPA: hypothetical protein VHN20_05785 [Beijerinckiaceae bacterium]|nr:hypothetical protein [Beijerinckiaceae bacterium]
MMRESSLNYFQVRALKLTTDGRRPLIVTHEDWQRQPTHVRMLLNELRTLVAMGLMSREDLTDSKEAYNLLPAGRAILQHHD